MTYPGGKAGSGVYQTLINLMPPHDVYIEPFLGGGAVMRLKRPAAVNIGIDLDPQALKLAMGPGRRRSPVPAMRGCQGVGMRGNAWKVSADSADPGDVRSPNFEFIHGNALEFLRSYPWTGRELVYCDPPYLLSSRADQQKERYRFEMTTEAEHLELLSLLKTIPARVLISGYSSALYAGELKKWNVAAFRAATRGAPAAEWVWYNFPKPVELHDYRFLGSDFRERERIKRKTKRWTAKLEKMPELERQALLAALSTTAGLGERRLGV
jgi:DNA adenine methylase